MVRRNYRKRLYREDFQRDSVMENNIFEDVMNEFEPEFRKVTSGVLDEYYRDELLNKYEVYFKNYISETVDGMLYMNNMPESHQFYRIVQNVSLNRAHGLLSDITNATNNYCRSIVPR